MHDLGDVWIKPVGSIIVVCCVAGGWWCSCLMGCGVCAFAAGSAGWVLEMFDRADAYSARFVLSKPQSNIQIQVGRFT